MSTTNGSGGARWRRRPGLWGATLVVSLAALLAWWSMGPGLTAQADTETAEVTRGDFVDLVTLRGNIKARRSVLIAAPSGAGELQIVRLARNGSEVMAGDVVVEFDATTVERSLSEKRRSIAAGSSPGWRRTSSSRRCPAPSYRRGSRASARSRSPTSTRGRRRGCSTSAWSC